MINQVLIDGRLTRDPELKYVGTGTPLLNMSLAHNEYRKDESQPTGWAQTVHYFEVSCWGKMAETMKGMLAKGTPVVVSAKLSQDRWQDKETQAKRSAVKLVAMKILLLHAKTAEGRHEEAAQAVGTESISDGPHVDDFQDDPIPF